MTKPPANWQDRARIQLTEAWKQMQKLSNFGRLIRDALRGDNYKAYQEALAWFNAEEREP